MKSYLIAVDLDGTLLDDEKNISLRNRVVLAKLRELGHKIVIATGRPFRSSKQYYRELVLDSPMVNFNGAYVHHPREPKSFQTSHSPIDNFTAKTIIETCESFQVKNIMVEIIDEFYLRYKSEKIVETFTFGQNPSHYGNLLEVLQDDPTSLLIHPDEKNHDELLNILEDAHAEIVDQRSWGTPWNMIEIVKAGLNKAVGLDQIAKYYDIPRERIIAFGDEENDLEMIDYAGYGVAMGNAIDELKNISKDVTKTNEEDGVAYYLEDFFNL